MRAAMLEEIIVFKHVLWGVGGNRLGPHCRVECALVVPKCFCHVWLTQCTAIVLPVVFGLMVEFEVCVCVSVYASCPWVAALQVVRKGRKCCSASSITHPLSREWVAIIVRVREKEMRSAFSEHTFACISCMANAQKCSPVLWGSPAFSSAVYS